jgi:hypothetical protein
MPRYHFNTECGDLRYEDQDGVELESIDQAEQQLLGLLRDMTMHDGLEDGNKIVNAQVRCRGNIVLQGSSSLTTSRVDVWSPKL